MKKLKYLIVIIAISILVFIGIEVFRKIENEEENNTTNNISENTSVETGINVEENTVTESKNTDDTNTTQEKNTQTSDNIEKKENLKNGEELMQKAEKTLTARGWAGASNNVIGLKDGMIYYYNKATEEFYPIAEGIEDIYYKEEYSEEITAKKNGEFKEIKETPQFLVYE